MLWLDPSSLLQERSVSSEPAMFMPTVRHGIALEADDFRLSPTLLSERFSFHCLRGNHPLCSGYWTLRSQIFCREQHLFEACDRDERDTDAIPIAALSHADHGEGPVVGVVRIFEESPGLWWGGRLGVASGFRRENQIGKGLIWKAVTTAHARGCRRFLATVQIQNVRFFRRLAWSSVEALEIQGIPHHLMEADLDYYRSDNISVDAMDRFRPDPLATAPGQPAAA